MRKICAWSSKIWATELNIHKSLRDSLSFMRICTFCAAGVKWMVSVFPSFLFYVLFFVSSSAEKNGCAEEVSLLEFFLYPLLNTVVQHATRKESALDVSRDKIHSDRAFGGGFNVVIHVLVIVNGAFFHIFHICLGLPTDINILQKCWESRIAGHVYLIARCKMMTTRNPETVLFICA